MTKILVKCYATERVNENGERVETIYMNDGTGLFVSPERPFSNNLVVASMSWTPCDRLPREADYLGHYAEQNGTF